MTSLGDALPPDRAAAFDVDVPAPSRRRVGVGALLAAVAAAAGTEASLVPVSTLGLLQVLGAVTTLVVVVCWFVALLTLFRRWQRGDGTGLGWLPRWWWCALAVVIGLVGAGVVFAARFGADSDPVRRVDGGYVRQVTGGVSEPVDETAYRRHVAAGARRTLAGSAALGFVAAIVLLTPPADRRRDDEGDDAQSPAASV